ncbi:MAG TPA: cupin domain-containing protein [Usitatibacter sp.]|jgi:quercetin dioxygenase-like cupin family protein|nr:cupin domain-containing protein [Usitatibacter sp.]
MNNTRKLFLAAALLAAFTVAAQAPAIKRMMLQKEGVTPEREAVLAQAEIAAGGQSGRHTHPGVEMGYVLEGPVVVEIDGESPRTLNAGDSFAIPYGKIHNAKAVGDKPAKVVSTYVVEKGKPLASPAN